MLEAAGASWRKLTTAFLERRDATQDKAVYHIKVIYSPMTKTRKVQLRGKHVDCQDDMQRRLRSMSDVDLKRTLYSLSSEEEEWEYLHGGRLRRPGARLFILRPLLTALPFKGFLICR
jgi:hypothetical protein